jgi:hypothetical protein
VLKGLLHPHSSIPYSQKSKSPMELRREVVPVGSIVRFVSLVTSDADKVSKLSTY